MHLTDTELTVLALVGLARDYRGLPEEDRAMALAEEIAHQKGTTVEGILRGR